MRYSAHNISPVNALHYTWTGWPRLGTSFPEPPPLDDLTAAWQTDGFTLTHHTFNPNTLQLAFKVQPQIAPTLFAQRVKGRLQHAYRKADRSVSFSRKIAMRAVGHNLSKVVSGYLRNQLRHVDLADPKYRAMLAKVACEDTSVDLAEPAETGSGRYWYNLHIVLVTADRYRMGGTDFLKQLREVAVENPRETGCSVRAVAIMPDHIHVALRGHPELSPIEIGIGLQNATAAVKGLRLWQEEFYVGSFSEYDLKALH